MLQKIKTAINLLTAWLLYFVSFLIPRSTKIWIFIGWHFDKEREIFADNSKYMFLYTSQNSPDLTSVWISENDVLPSILRGEGYKAYSIKSIKGIYYSLRAKYTFLDAFMKLQNWRYSGRSNVIQLWHGKGMKKTGFDSPYSLKRYNRIISPNLFTEFHKLIASSDYTAKLMASTFRVSLKNILITGLPRNDVLFHDIENSEIGSCDEFKKHLHEIRSENEKIILYAPTFRPDGSNSIESLDLESLNYLLKNKKHHLILSWHPKFARKDLVQKVSRSNISIISSGYDIYPYLKEIDVLITDYSSLYVDFLLLDKPIIFYIFDLEKYKKQMGLHVDFNKLTPGPHPKNFDELLISLESKDDYAQIRIETRKKMFKFYAGKSAERITKSILKKP